MRLFVAPFSPAPFFQATGDSGKGAGIDHDNISLHHFSDGKTVPLIKQFGRSPSGRSDQQHMWIAPWQIRAERDTQRNMTHVSESCLILHGKQAGWCKNHDLNVALLSISVCVNVSWIWVPFYAVRLPQPQSGRFWCFLLSGSSYILSF